MNACASNMNAPATSQICCKSMLAHASCREHAPLQHDVYMQLCPRRLRRGVAWRDAVPCCAVLYLHHAVPCHLMPYSCRTVPCRSMPMPCHVVPRRTVLVPSRAVKCCAMPCAAVRCHAMPCPPCRATTCPCHAVVRHATAKSCHTKTSRACLALPRNVQRRKS